MAAARLEGVFLDPVYTAKALSGLAAEVREGGIGKDEPTVFVHTGGLPGLFGHPLIRELVPPSRGGPAGKEVGDGEEEVASITALSGGPGPRQRRGRRAGAGSARSPTGPPVGLSPD